MPFLNGRRLIAVVLLFCLSCTLSGCWNRRELNTFSFIGMVGIDADKANQNLKLTVELLKPQKEESENTEDSVRYIQVTGRTVFDALRNITLKIDRRVFGALNRAFLIGEDIDVPVVITDHFLRDHEDRLSTALYICQGASAAEVMGIAGGIQPQPSGYLNDLWKEQQYNGKSINSTVLDFVKAYLSKGKNPVLGVIRKVEKVKSKQQKQEYELSVEGAAVFAKSRLAGYLNGMETQGYNWVESKNVDWPIIAALPDKQGYIAVQVRKIHRTKEVELAEGAVKLKIHLDITGKLSEVTGPATSLDEPATIEAFEQVAAQTVKREVEHTLSKLQHEYRSDIYGFGQTVHRKYPREWSTMQDNWDDNFANANSEVSVNVTLTQIGKSKHTVKQ